MIFSVNFQIQKRRGSMIQIPVALQLYSLREMFPVNPLETLKTVKEMGFTGVEFYGCHFQNDFYSSLLKETGLV